MTYRIEWLPGALRGFTAEWETLDPQRQRVVMDMLDGIDFQMMNRPLDSGESRGSSGERVLFNLPVVVVYRVTARIALVEVVAAKTVW